MKIIGSDYDGTLNCHGIRDGVRVAIADWQNRGNKFGIVTGRGISSIFRETENNNVRCDFFVANNGAVIADGNGNIICQEQVSQEVIFPLLKHILYYGCKQAGIVLGKSESLVYDGEKGLPQHYNPDNCITIEKAAESSYFTQISTFCNEENQAEILTSQINDKFGKSVVAYQNGVCIDIVALGVSKATGIYRLLEIYGAKREDVCTVGDNNNDLAMLEAFRSYAVENAIQRVKQTAGKVVFDIEELIKIELGECKE